MIGYVTLGTNDIPRAAAFYDELLKLLGAGRFMESETMVAWAVSPGQARAGRDQAVSTASRPRAATA